ncbi:MAG TPA: hypothetical protein PLO23_03055 [Alphaproteobacteria bacterium]|nr:hypothetical protein [Alphaproteobacteria bacterium]
MILRTLTALILLTALSLLSWPAGNAQAACCQCEAQYVGPTSTTEWTAGWPIGSIPVLNAHIDNEFNAHETWLVKFLLEDNVLPAMMLMAEQLTAAATAQVGIIGTFLDAKQQLETQRTVQKLQAEIQRDYHPSIGLCEFGSGIKSLAATERVANYNAVFLAQRSLDRQLGSAYVSGFGGEQYDKENRMAQFKTAYCDLADNNTGLASVCGAGGTDKQRLNKDIDFARTLGTPWTLEVYYGNAPTTPEVKPDEEDVFALQNNIFGHKVFTRIPPRFMVDQYNTSGGFRDPIPVREAYLDMRSVIAKRGVAENSFEQYAGMKAEGTGASTEYLREMMKELGIEVDADLEKLLGKNPSYYAQMEVLTKKIYQNPDFYTNLYDKPANVNRKEAAIAALELIQKFDMFKSNLRAEANLSLMLENAVMRLQSEDQNSTARPATDLNPLEGEAPSE